MVKKLRIIFFSLMLLVLLVSCAPGAGTFGGFDIQAEPVLSEVVTRPIQYYDEGELGPLHAFSVLVPEEWVGEFDTTFDRNQVTFNFLRPNGIRAPIFSIQALSYAQFWEQNGSYPSQFENLGVSGNTYFIYNLPIDAYYSGLPDEEFDLLSAVVPEVLVSFQAAEIESSDALLTGETIPPVFDAAIIDDE